MAPNLKYPKDFSNLAALQAALEKDGNGDRNSNLDGNTDQAGASVATFPPLTSIIKKDETPVSAKIENNINRNADNDHDEYFLTDLEEPPSSSSNQQASSNRVEEEEKAAAVEATEEELVSRARRSRRIIRKLSSMVQDPVEFNVDERRLHRATEEVGKCAYGVQAISVWLFDDDSDRLYPSEGGWWYNPSLVDQSDALSRLVDSHRKDYVPAKSVSPGVDIAGLLWLESNKFERVASMVINRVTSTPQLSVVSTPHASNDTLSSLHPHQHRDEMLIWRDLKSLVDDPDTAKGPRMSLLHEAGFGQATGVEFQTELLQRGLVVFFASKDSMDNDILNGHANFVYLRQAAHYIGGAAAMAEARRALVGQQIEKGLIKRRSDASESHASDDIESAGTPPTKPAGDKKKVAATTGTLPRHKEEDEEMGKCGFILHRIKKSMKKAKGGGLQIPPSLSVRQSLWTCFGAFCGLLVLSSLNEYYQYLSDDEYFLLIGPFGALMTLQYGLTAAPASQPRNAVMGQAVAGAVSLAFTYIPEHILPVWLRRAVGPAIGIAMMVKCGFTHPPAGAHAVLYASGKYNFAFYALVVFSTAVSVIPATLVNNLSIKRQYPTYWGFTLPKGAWALPQGWVFPDLSSAFTKKPTVGSWRGSEDAVSNAASSQSKVLASEKDIVVSA